MKFDNEHLNEIEKKLKSANPSQFNDLLKQAKASAQKKTDHTILEMPVVDSGLLIPSTHKPSFGNSNATTNFKPLTCQDVFGVMSCYAPLQTLRKITVRIGEVSFVTEPSVPWAERDRVLDYLEESTQKVL